MSRGDGLFAGDPLEPAPNDSLEMALDRLLSANLINQQTTYETFSNYIIKLIKLFRNKDETSVNISKFCNFTESSLNNLQIRLSRKAFDVCLSKLDFWIRKVSSGDLLNDLFRALGSVLYGAGSMSDLHRDNLLLKQDSLLSNFLTETTDCNMKRLAYQCIANLSIRMDRGVIHENLQDRIFDLLLDALLREKRANDDVISYLRLVVICFEGLTSLAQYNKAKFASSLGYIFAAARYYMVLGLPGFYDLPQKRFEPLKNTSIMSKMGSGSSQQTAFNLALFRAQKKKPELYPDYSDSEDETRNDETPDFRGSEFFINGGGPDSFKTLTIDRKEIIGSHDSQFSMICETKEKIGSKGRSDQVGNDISKMTGVCKKVRSVALKALYEVLKTAPPKLSFGYWWNFIPDENTSDFVPSDQPFFFLLLKDKNVKSRTEALNCLSQFLILARPYILAAADDRHDPKAYTPYSYTLATSIKELNRLIVQITSSDYGFVTLPIALKAFAELVLSTPYHKLRFGLLTRIVRHLINFLNSSHCPTRIEAFKCLTSVVQIDPPLAEIYELFKGPTPPPRARLMTEECPDTPNSYRYVLSGAHTPLVSYGLYGAVSEPLSNSSRGSFSSSRQNLATISSTTTTEQFAQDENALEKMAISASPAKCWSLAVVEDVVFNGHPITKESANPDQETLKVSALNFVAALSLHYLRILAGSLTDLWEILQRGLQYEQTTAGSGGGGSSLEIRLASLKTTAQIARSMRRTNTNQAVDQNEFLLFQSRVLTEQLIPLLDSSCKSQLKAVTCDCMSALAPEVYEQIRDQSGDKMKCVDLVLKYSSEGDPQVSPAALKTLGSYVQSLPSLRDDYVFMRNVADTVIKLTSSSNRYVRSRGAWVLANLCDNFTCLSDQDPNFISNLTSAVFIQCLKATLEQAEDQDRCKYNAVRGICGLLSCVQAPITETTEVNEMINTCFDLITKLITGPTLSKVQWNTCISAGKIFKNKFLCHINSRQQVQRLINALLQALQNCSNYRVKINALTSLGDINDRQTFTAKLLYQSISICLQTFEDTENLTDFDQYRHQAELQQSLCLFICHVIKLMNKEDFPEISKLFRSPLSEVITQSFRNCALKAEYERIFEEVQMKLQDFDPKNENLISLIVQSRKSDSFASDSKVFDFVPHNVFNTK